MMCRIGLRVAARLRVRETRHLRGRHTLIVRCEYDNSPANQPFLNGERIQPRDATWGEGSARRDVPELRLVPLRAPRFPRGGGNPRLTPRTRSRSSPRSRTPRARRGLSGRAPSRRRPTPPAVASVAHGAPEVRSPSRPRLFSARDEARRCAPEFAVCRQLARQQSPGLTVAPEHVAGVLAQQRLAQKRGFAGRHAWRGTVARHATAAPDRRASRAAAATLRRAPNVGEQPQHEVESGGPAVACSRKLARSLCRIIRGRVGDYT